ncbi:MAG: hypothetical protein J5627_01910 [Bacilli bacterium]|nr:hypothetical protein [Bacilli bacterium]
MDSYIKWYDSLDKVVKIIFSVFFWFCFLYRLFILIEDKAKDTGRLVFFIINCIPGISFIVWVIDIAYAITKQSVPLSFDDLNSEPKKEDDVIDAEEEK